MSARGGRGGPRNGNHNNHNNRGGRARARDGNTPPTQPSADRATQPVYTRGNHRGANRGGASRGPASTPRGSTNTDTRGSTRGRGNHVSVPAHVMAFDPSGGANTTPFAPKDYAKRLEHIKALRPQLRQRFINEGRMNPEGQMRLCDSVKLFGLCTDMCPEYERVRRIVEEDVKPPECTPETQHLPRKQRIPDEHRMVKAYSRSAAGMDVELVSEIRSPATCLKTINYLMSRLDGDSFDFLHSWIWDRTRSIRKDLRTQRIQQRSDINVLLQCLERCARYLLLAAHQMARTKKEDYTHHQDIEQLNATLISLQERYIDNRRVGYPSENEAEFWAYRLILAPLFTNTLLEDQFQKLPSDIRNNPRVLTALEIFRSMKSIIFTSTPFYVQSQANWKRFWDLIKSPSVSYLMACAAEISFQRVRHVVLDGLWRTYRKGAPSRPQVVDSWKPDMLQDVMGFDTATEAVNFCEAFGFQFKLNTQNQTYLDVTGKGFAKIKLPMGSDVKPQVFSNGIVEVKRMDRAFSAIVSAMSVREAQTRGLMINSVGGTKDSDSLFVPETATKSTNPFLPFTQPSGTASDTSTNSFLPQTTSAPAVGQPANPFITAHTTKAFSGFNPVAAQPGSFDAAKKPFATPGPANTPFANIDTSNLFGTTPSSIPVTSPTSADSVTSTPQVNHFLQFKPGAQQQQPAVTTPATPPVPQSFPGFNLGAGQSQPSNAPFTFTPAGSPALPKVSSQDAEKKKAEEEEKRQKAAAEALAQQQRAEQHRQRLQQEERDRIAREAREIQAREEAARMARLQVKNRAWDTLANDCMFDTNQGLMMQFIENLVVNTANEVVETEKEAKRRQLWEKKKALANAMHEQRILGLKRLVMATWIAKIGKKKRVEQARARRRRLKERKAQMVNGEDAPSSIPTPAESETSAAPVNEEAVFQKPQAPASARRARRTEERRVARNPQQNGSVQPGESAQQVVVQTVLTPVSMNGSQTSSLGYSEAYQNSNIATVDRTETDYFTLRAQGLDPHKFRKRSFDSSSGDNSPEVEIKRPRIAPQNNDHPHPPPRTATEAIAVRLHAVRESFRKSGGSPQPLNGAVSVSGQASPKSNRKSLLEQAKQALGKSTVANGPSPNLQHDWGRSVPNLGFSTSSARQSVLGNSTTAALTDDRPAYWARKSRFVPQHLYGQGPEAVRAYRMQYGLNSPAGSRASTTEPLAISSPIPVQQSYQPENGYTQEHYSEEEVSDIEVVDVDAEDEDEESEVTEEEYEGDEESEEADEDGYPPPTYQVNRQQEYEEDDDSEMSDSGLDYAGGHPNGRYGDSAAEALNDYEAYTEDGNEYDEEDTLHQHHFSQQQQHAQRFQYGQPAQQSQQLKSVGNTEDDAIELSD
ncbi:hypothetical protein CC86DRAFT_371976 [Ophiobolus disseminans]|uniref:SAC3/GANP/THP3 conserved domain-containing protein n=1 Tax=Ophiobolus disseminans TaxID=1469910 RepID=A0A6A6ZT16_9PLEO|nr:hypothetical protein CC86DRAFT_371976 [Ophiobolus disseminans]